VLCKVKKFDKPEEQYKAPANVVFTDFDDSEETVALKKRMTAYLLSNLASPVKEPGGKEAAELREEVLKSNLDSVVKARFCDFASKYTPPASLEPVYDIISGLYSCPQKVFESLTPGVTPGKDWAKLFHDEITPSIGAFDWKTRKAIMQCIALSLGNNNGRFKDLPLQLKNII
jgi:hypothetical protein